MPIIEVNVPVSNPRELSSALRAVGISEFGQAMISPLYLPWDISLEYEERESAIKKQVVSFLEIPESEVDFFVNPAASKSSFVIVNINGMYVDGPEDGHKRDQELQDDLAQGVGIAISPALALHNRRVTSFYEKVFRELDEADQRRLVEILPPQEVTKGEVFVHPFDNKACGFAEFAA